MSAGIAVLSTLCVLSALIGLFVLAMLAIIAYARRLDAKDAARATMSEAPTPLLQPTRTNTLVPDDPTDEDGATPEAVPRQPPLPPSPPRNGLEALSFGIDPNKTPPTDQQDDSVRRVPPVKRRRS